MSKRFTDTEKWNKKFIRSLPPAYKLFFLFILDECTTAGIWDVDVEVAKLKLGVEISEQDAVKFFGKKIVVIDEGAKWFVPDFIEFQYGQLNFSNRAHHKAIHQLKKFNLIDENFFVKKGLCEVAKAPIQGASEGPMVMVKEEEGVKEEEMVVTQPEVKFVVVPQNDTIPVAQVSMIGLLNVEDCIVEYFRNNMYARTRETLCMKFHMLPDALLEWGFAYNREMVSRGDLAKSMQDWCSHFNNWLNRQDRTKNPLKLFQNESDNSGNLHGVYDALRKYYSQSSSKGNG